MTEGPLGFPLTDKQAFALDALLKAGSRAEEFKYRKTLSELPPTELAPGERADVSWISTENPDRTQEVVLARGLNDSQFKLNPIVTLNHVYWMQPVGKSLWRKVVKDGSLRGIKAKTVYPARPGDWPAGKDWPPDCAFSLVQAGLLRGKSIGLLPTKVHVPDKAERDTNRWDKVGLVIDEWLLLEYACVFLPAQQNAVVEQVSKSLLQVPPDFLRAFGMEVKGLPAPVAFTPLEEIERAIARRIEQVDFAGLAQEAVREHLDRARGRV